MVPGTNLGIGCRPSTFAGPNLTPPSSQDIIEIGVQGLRIGHTIAVAPHCASFQIASPAASQPVAAVAKTLRNQL